MRGYCRGRPRRWLSLADLKPGQRGKVVGLSAPGPVLRRLAEMGVLPGAEVEVKGIAPLGDPMVIGVKGYRLSLRKSEGRGVVIDPVE